eukprot:11951392-Alexandrium_andersonii.AAC.1
MGPRSSRGVRSALLCSLSPTVPWRSAPGGRTTSNDNMLGPKLGDEVDWTSPIAKEPRSNDL